MLEYKLNSWSFFDLAMLKITIFVNQSEGERKFLKEIDFNQRSNKGEPQEQTSNLLKHLE